MERLKSALLNLLTMMASVGLLLLCAEVVLRFLPVAPAPAVEPPTAENPIQRYVANQPFTWSFDWDMHDVVRGRRTRGAGRMATTAGRRTNALDWRPQDARIQQQYPRLSATKQTLHPPLDYG